MEDHNSNPADELRERFRSELGLPPAQRYYSEDELIDIFDNSGDAGDDYLRTEALLLGARLYPDSQALLERRAIFYRGFTDNSFNDFLDDNPALDGPLWEILRLSRFRGSRKEAVRQIENLLERYSLKEDEEVIQFVQLTRDLHVQDWLYDNLDRVRERVEYLPTLLYETGVNAEYDSRFDICIKVLEELTELEPYSAAYWSMLATAYMASQRPDDAAGAVDLALAIDPDSADALKVRLALLPHEDTEGISNTLDRLMALAPDDFGIACQAVKAAEDRGDNAAARRILDSALDRNPGSIDLVSIAVAADHPGLDRILEAMFDAGVTEPDDWNALAETAATAGQPELVPAIMQAFHRKSGTGLHHDYLLLRMLFAMEQYHQVVNMMREPAEDGTIRQPGNIMPAYAMMLISMLRLGEIDSALDMARSVISMIENAEVAAGNEMERYGMSCLAQKVIDLAADPDTDWNKFNPPGLGL